MNWLQKLSQSDSPPWTQTWSEFISFHRTGNISDGYGEKGQGYDLSDYNNHNQHGGYYSPTRYPILLDKKVFNVPRYGNVEVEFRQSGRPTRYAKSRLNKDGISEIMRDKDGNIIYFSEDELKARDLPIKDPTIYMFSNGLCIGHVGDSFGATELFVVREFQGGGIGPYALKLYMENNPQAYKRPLGQMTLQGVNTAKKTWMLFVEEAIERGEDIPSDVLSSYEHEKRNYMMQPRHREVYDIPKFHTKRVQLYNSGVIPPTKGFNEDLLIQMGVKFWDVERDISGQPLSWRVDRDVTWDDAYDFIKSFGYEEEGYRTFTLKMDYSGDHGVILPADTQ